MYTNVYLFNHNQNLLTHLIHLLLNIIVLLLTGHDVNNHAAIHINITVTITAIDTIKASLIPNIIIIAQHNNPKKANNINDPKTLLNIITPPLSHPTTLKRS